MLYIQDENDIGKEIGFNTYKNRSRNTKYKGRNRNNVNNCLETHLYEC